MKKIIAICFFLSLFPSVFHANLFIGGVSRAQAYNPLPVFQVTVENNVSKVTTVMYVYAPTETIAKENVILNGWAIKEIKKLSDKEKAKIILSDDGVKGGGKIIINSFEDTPLRKDTGNSPERKTGIIYDANPSAEQGKEGEGAADNATLPAISDNISMKVSPNALVAFPMNSSSSAPESDSGGIVRAGRVAEDNLEILPDSPELEYILTVNFDFAQTEPKLNDQLSYRLKVLPKDRKYIVFGHADEVIVGKNALYKNNYTLSYMRAEEIKKIMASGGISADNIKTVGLGVKYPLEDTKGSSLANRRAEIYGFRTQK